MKEESLPISFGGSQSLFRRPLRPFRGGIVSPAWVVLGKRFRVGRGTAPPPGAGHLGGECGGSLCDWIPNMESGKDEQALERMVGRGDAAALASS